MGSGMGTASRAQRLAGASIGQRQRHSGGRLQTDETKLQRQHARAMRPTTPYTLYSLPWYGRVGGHFCEERSRARVTNKQNKTKKAAGTPTNTQVNSRSGLINSDRTARGLNRAAGAGGKGGADDEG